MHKTRIAALVATLLCGLVLVSVVLVGAMSSDNYGVPWDARYGGGGLTSSANYAVNGTVGQGAIGWTESANYGVGTGYWYGVLLDRLTYLPVIFK